jgi:hypothetical protein
MSIYEILKRFQRTTAFSSTAEMSYYLENNGVLSSVEAYNRFLKAETRFDIVRANILIRALLNKETIEKLYLLKSKSAKKGDDQIATTPLEDFMASSMSELPYLTREGKKIYVPIFPTSLNSIYSGDWAKLGLNPYKKLLQEYEAATIDPFEYYGYGLFDSYFTKLVAIRTTPHVMAAYDFDAEAIYFIDDEGRLDAELCLFDKYLRNPSKNHMIKRIEAVVDAYFADDRAGLIKALVDQKLVSSKLMHKLTKADVKASLHEDKKSKKGLN